MPIKILFLSHDADLQGAERCLLDLVSHLDRTRFEPLVILPWPGPLEEKLAQAQVPYLVRYVLKPWIGFNKRSKTWNWPLVWLQDGKSRLWSLLTLIEREKIDLIYTNTSTLIEGALAAKRAGIPHLWHVHEHLHGNEDLRLFLPAAWIDRITTALSDRILSPSATLANARFPNCSKVRIVPNGIDLNALQKGDGGRVRAELGIPPQAPVITFIGALSPRKDPITFIQAAAHVHRRFPEARFLLAGASADLDLERQARQLAETAGLADHPYFLGYRHDVADLLDTATVHVSSSRQESFGLTLIEAMAAGKPVVATRCGGPEEVVIDDETGFVVPPGDPEAVAQAILSLLENPEKAKAMGEAGRRRAETRFSIEAYARNIEAVLEEVLQ